MHFTKRSSAVALCGGIIAFCLSSASTAAEIDSLLTRARILFYAGVEQAGHIDSAIALFQQIGELDRGLRGRTITYVGALTALRAKHAKWPHDKWRFANEGLQRMDEGLALAPEDVEALFVHGTTCYYLPVFFGRADDAQKNLHALARLLPDRHQHYDRTLVHNVIDFLLQHLRLSKLEKENLVALKSKLALH